MPATMSVIHLAEGELVISRELIGFTTGPDAPTGYFPGEITCKLNGEPVDDERVGELLDAHYRRTVARG